MEKVSSIHSRTPAISPTHAEGTPMDNFTLSSIKSRLEKWKEMIWMPSEVGFQNDASVVFVGIIPISSGGQCCKFVAQAQINLSLENGDKKLAAGWVFFQGLEG